MKFIKKDKIFEWLSPNSWWKSHTMAPSAIYWKGKIRVFIGAWDENPISRITYIDLDPLDPTKVLKVKDDSPILDIGKKGMFDDNGVFPAHANVIDNKIHLFYTGFQTGKNVPHFNFGGLAISEDGENFRRVSHAPILDRADEGLLVRAGQSVLKEKKNYKIVYSAGSKFSYVGNKLRPHYDIFFQESRDSTNLQKKGFKIIEANEKIEHGLGRPQLIKIKDKYFVFYTRRKLDMKYFMGASSSKDLKKWNTEESLFNEIHHSNEGFDSEMIYFPSVVFIPNNNKHLLFYCGNEFGKTGIGYCELV